MTAESILFALLRTAVCGEKRNYGVLVECTPEKLSEVYALANQHDLAHLAGYALEGVELPRCAVLAKFKEAKAQAIYRYMRQNFEFEQVCSVLDAADLSYIPLKGAVLRCYYPEAWMRTSADIDILVKEENLDDAVSELKDKLRYTGSRKSDHDYSLYSKSGVHLELHYDTVEQRYAEERRRSILADIWHRTYPESAEKKKHLMTDDLFYFYYAAHLAKHFETGGCGIRAILDVWIMNHRMQHNREARESLLQKGGLLPFMKVIEQVAEAWFSGGEMDALAQQVGEYILRGGVYGNEENRAAFGQAKTGGKWRYLITRRVFMPYDYLKAEYPILKKYIWLTPMYQIVRWGRMLSAGKVKRYLREIRSNILTQNKIRKDAEKLLRQLELK